MDDLLSDRLTLRVDPETRREWKAQAKEEHRALSNWVVWMVEQARKKQDPRDS